MKTKLLILILLAALLLPQASSAQAQGTDPRQMGSQIVTRAKVWVDNKVPYNQNGYKDSYRTDCSGFVSYAWQLKKDDKNNAKSVDTTKIKDYAVYVSLDALQPGDVINNERPGDSGHVVIFVRWITTGSKFVAYEENADYGKAVSTTLNLTYLKNGGRTIKEYESYAPGPYVAQRYNKIPGFVNVYDFSLSTTSPKVGNNVTARFTIRNDGAQPVYIAQLVAGARGPDSKSKLDWNDSNVDFPVVKNILLSPGISSNYSQSRTFSKDGWYFAEPVKDQNGWGGIWPYRRIYFYVNK